MSERMPAREPSEPEITINGRRLTTAEAMTVRVALETLAFSVADDGLGEDETGRAIAAGYLRAIESIRADMYAKRAKP